MTLSSPSNLVILTTVSMMWSTKPSSMQSGQGPQTAPLAPAQQNARLEQQRRMHLANAHEGLHTSIGADPPAAVKAEAPSAAEKSTGKENGQRVAATVKILEDLKASTTAEEYQKVRARIPKNSQIQRAAAAAAAASSAPQPLQHPCLGDAACFRDARSCICIFLPDACVSCNCRGCCVAATMHVSHSSLSSLFH
jgi:hypothetical protein